MRAVSSFQFLCVVLILLVVITCMRVSAADGGSTVRSYISDLSKELDTLNCTFNKLNSAIFLLSQVNGTFDIVARRRKQLQKIQSAIDLLSTERNVLNSKCNVTLGDNCDGGCTPGHTGIDCSQITCFGVPSYNTSVCSGRGNCIGPDTCNCTNILFFGNNCQLPKRNFTLAANTSLGYKYEDGQYARSCKEYRFPSSPYIYNNEGSGLYQIKPGSTVMTVYCDMTTDGGGWTLFAGIPISYIGYHFHVFDDKSAVPTSQSSEFHISTEDLMAISNEIRAATDSAAIPVSNFHTSTWAHSASCVIPPLLRSDINYTRTVPYTSLKTFYNQDREASCKILSGNQVVPTHLAYSKADTIGHSIGFRMGRSSPSMLSHMDGNTSIFATFSYVGAPEGSQGYDYKGVFFTGDKVARNGVLFLR